MSLRRVVVTGLGLVTPLGDDPDVFFGNLMAAKSGVSRLRADFSDRIDTRIAAQVDFEPQAYFPKHKAANLDRATQFALAAASRALIDAGIDAPQTDQERFGVFVGTGMGGAASLDESYFRLYAEKAERLKPFTVLMTMANAASAHIAVDFDLRGPNLTFTTACSSSAVAIGEAWRQLRDGSADIMLAGGTEAMLTFGAFKAWEALRTLAAEDTDDPASSCKPFSKNRSGLVLGEGAGMFVLETLDHAVARGARIHGEIIGYGSGSDSAHMTKPSVEGQTRAITSALRSAGISPGDVHYINAHGTGTVANDSTKSKASVRPSAPMPIGYPSVRPSPCTAI